ncbi:hypothetical protein FA15DRAFT_710445 [Coprinopsis marcescibilis]|uniref:Fungal-type protein kinase domain-containing protein n=1 Tax=Coprinopsis marcescibilis TaxID=230819 RepID=A0A5C3KCJ4_COPMA|nr:hypothetical protein FA15DRAFT_710445 [Coprinopsis marcescibilis]
MDPLLSNAPESNLKHHSGTIPFIAHELLDTLDDLPSDHFLRHDLDSLLYILMWVTQSLPDHHNWKQGLLRNGTGKSDSKVFLARQKGATGPLTEFEQLKADWVAPLITLWCDAMFDREHAERRDKNFATYDHATLGGQLTFQTFMEAIKEAIEKELLAG